MRKFLLMSVMLVMTTIGLGCGLTVEQRQELVEMVSTKATVAIKEKMREAAVDIVAGAVEAVTKKAAEFGLSEENLKKLGEATKGIMDEKINELIEEKVPEVIKKVVEKVIPKATESTGGGGTGKGILGSLIALVPVLLGLGNKGGAA